MDNAETLITVAKQLRELFAEKSELKGFDDWDRLIGCIITIQNVAQALTDEAEVVTDGE